MNVRSDYSCLGINVSVITESSDFNRCRNRDNMEYISPWTLLLWYFVLFTYITFATWWEKCTKNQAQGRMNCEHWSFSSNSCATLAANLPSYLNLCGDGYVGIDKATRQPFAWKSGAHPHVASAWHCKTQWDGGKRRSRSGELLWNCKPPSPGEELHGALDLTAAYQQHHHLVLLPGGKLVCCMQI